MFATNFARYADHVSEDVRLAGPRSDGAETATGSLADHEDSPTD